ncbi:hypothetical protein BC833DRAFT_587321 [Globomyces pollinis-pini]|nr:hypothetical protein BC833DRAFT_587321 [Globomyces pollinis-pini]
MQHTKVTDILKNHQDVSKDSFGLVKELINSTDHRDHKLMKSIHTVLLDVALNGNPKELIVFILEHVYSLENDLTVLQQSLLVLVICKVYNETYPKQNIVTLNEIVQLLEMVCQSTIQNWNDEFFGWQYGNSILFESYELVLNKLSNNPDNLNIIHDLSISVVSCLLLDGNINSSVLKEYVHQTTSFDLSIPTIFDNTRIKAIDKSMYLSMFGHCEMVDLIPSVIPTIYIWNQLLECCFLLECEDSKYDTIILYQKNLLEHITLKFQPKSIKFDGFDAENNYSSFFDRYWNTLLSCSTQKTSQMLYTLLKNLIHKFESNSQIHIIMKLLNSSNTSLIIIGLELLKLVIHDEFMDSNLTPSYIRWFSSSLFSKTFFPLLFNLDSNLYTVQEFKYKNILENHQSFIHRMDVIMHILNLFRYLEMRDQNFKYGILNENQLNDILIHYIQPISLVLCQLESELQNPTSSLTKEMTLQGGQQNIMRISMSIMLLRDSISVIETRLHTIHNLTFTKNVV